MDLTLYYAPFSSAVPVASALDELGVPYEKVVFDLAKRDQKQPDYLKLNPNGKVPTLVVDGTPMFEALAILQFLGATFGVELGLWPALGTPERLTAHAWATWAYVEYGPVIHRLYLATQEEAPAELKSAAWADHARGEAQHLLGLLDAQLAKTGYVVGDRYSLADLIVSGLVMWSTYVSVPTSDHPHVSRWLAELNERPAIKKEFS